jgi:hypothetical protein
MASYLIFQKFENRDYIQQNWVFDFFVNQGYGKSQPEKFRFYKKLKNKMKS